MAAWATPDALLKLLSDNFDDEGRLKEESTMMARGTFAVVFKGDTIPGGDAQCVVRVTVIPPGDNQELAFDKELQALIAYLKLMKGESSGAPVRDQFVEIRREDQPAGLCRTDAYYIVTTEGRRVVFTVMPLGIPLMNIIEDQLVISPFFSLRLQSCAAIRTRLPHGSHRSVLDLHGSLLAVARKVM